MGLLSTLFCNSSVFRVDQNYLLKRFPFNFPEYSWQVLIFPSNQKKRKINKGYVAETLLDFKLSKILIWFHKHAKTKQTNKQDSHFILSICNWKRLQNWSKRDFGWMSYSFSLVLEIYSRFNFFIKQFHNQFKKCQNK